MGSRRQNPKACRLRQLRGTPPARSLNNMDRLVKFIAIAVVASLALVFYIDRAESAQAEAWQALAAARQAGMSIESLETALEQTRGTDAEPFARVQLAAACLAEGTAESIQRARQVADEGLAAQPGSTTSAWLSKLSNAAMSLEG